MPPAQVALAWLLHKPGVTAPIVGATKLSHLEDAVAAEQLSLDDKEIARLEEPVRGPPRPRALSGASVGQRRAGVTVKGWKPRRRPGEATAAPT